MPNLSTADFERQYQLLVGNLKLFFELNASKVDAEHGIEHAYIVMNHCLSSFRYGKFTPYQKFVIKIAALLHDVDDGKFFDTEDYQNARDLIKDTIDEPAASDIIKCVSLVSYTSNGNSQSADFDDWMLWPRHADRLEAMGGIGIQRAFVYTMDRKHKIYDENTPRVTNYDELQVVLRERERIRETTGYIKATTFMGYFFDKLVYIGLNTGNKYLDGVSAKRMPCVYNVIYEFGRTGHLSEDRIVQLIQENID